MSKMKLPKAIRLPKTKGGRIFAVVVILVVAALVAYFVHGAVAGDDSAKVTYTTGTVEKMTLTSSVSGEGNIEWLSLCGRHLEHLRHGQPPAGGSGRGGGRRPEALCGRRFAQLQVGDRSHRGHHHRPQRRQRRRRHRLSAATIIDLDAFEAVITVAESDIASVKVGQKAVITFDALPDLTLTGKVKSVDYTGTNTSGVVSYEVVVTPDTPNENVSGGMTVSVNIITDVATDVLAVPSSAVKTSSDGSSYVQVLDDTVSRPTSPWKRA